MADIELIARGLWLKHDFVLLCQNRKHGYYFLPGGHVELGESSAAALRREFVEEVGIEITVGPPLLLLEQTFTAKRQHHELSVVFHVEHSGDPDVESLEEKIAFEWVPLAAVSELDVRPDPIRAWLSSGGRSEGTPTPLWLSSFSE